MSTFVLRVGTPLVQVLGSFQSTVPLSELTVESTGVATVTVSPAVVVVLTLFCASFSVAVAVSVKFPSLVGLIVRLERVQPLILIGVLPSLVTVCARVPSL